MEKIGPENDETEDEDVPEKHRLDEQTRVPSGRMIEATKCYREKRCGEPWQDVLLVRSGGAVDVATAKLLVQKLNQC